MSDDDIPSPTESDPISDVNPDEMAKLMADLDEMDDDLFKSEKKVSKNISPDQESAKKVSFQTDRKSSKDDDDWDSADDLLNLDDEKQSKAKRQTDNTESEKSKPDINQDSKAKSPLKTSPNNKKHKLLDNLFSSSSNTDEKDNEVTNKTIPEKTKLTNKREINFDEESDPLKMSSRSKHTDPDFMSSLLEESSITKPKKKPLDEFCLPDKYKNADATQNSGKPSNSPGKKGVKSDLVDDLFGDGADSRPRRTLPRRANKKFEVKDDDILTTSSVKLSQNSENERKTQQDDWLFSSPKKTPVKPGGRKETSPVMDNAEDKFATVSGSPLKGDWLNQLLPSKSSPTVQKTPLEQSQVVTSPVKDTVVLHPQKTHPPVNHSPVKLVSGLTSPFANAISIIQNEMVEQQAKMEAEAAAMTTMLQAQQREMSSQMLQQFQLQLQEQQQQMAQMVFHKKSISLPSFSTSISQNTGEDDESIKQLKIDLHKAETEVGRLQAELSLVREQHQREVQILTDSQKKQELVREDVWKRTEGRLIEEKADQVEKFDAINRELQKEKTVLAASYEERLSQSRAEMTEAMQRAKEMYGDVVERMKKEHLGAIERLTQLKEVELKAALTAVGHVKEVEHVVTQLEANTADLSEMKKVLTVRHESALELVKKSLQVKEKQLKETEGYLEVVRADAESERNRLTVLVTRLESSLANQGTEIESQKWSLAQEKMKLDVEKTALVEEKRHFQMAMEFERRQVAELKQRLLKEQREGVELLTRQKAQICEHDSRQRAGVTTLSVQMEILELKEEKKILAEKISSFQIQKEEARMEQKRLEEHTTKLSQDLAKNLTLEEILSRKEADLEARSRDLETKEEKLEESRRDLQTKLSEITLATKNLHLQRDALSKERARIEARQEETLDSLVAEGLCFPCSLKLRATPSLLTASFDRAPGDGSEMHRGRPLDQSHKSFDRISVLNRLKAAREEEARVRRKKLNIQR